MRTSTLMLLFATLVGVTSLAAADESAVTTKGDDKLSIPGVADVEIPENCFKEKTKVTLNKTALKETVEDFSSIYEGKDRIPYEIRINTGKTQPTCAFKLKMTVPTDFTKKSTDKNAEPALYGQEFTHTETEIYDIFQIVTADFDAKKETLSGEISPKLFTNERTNDKSYEAIVVISQDVKFTPPQQDILPLQKSEIFNDAYIVADAQFERDDFNSANPSDEKRNDIPVAFHRIKGGKGTIIALRMFDPGDTDATDDELFEKITISMEQLKPGTYIFGKDKIKAYYSRGGSAWPNAQCGYILDNGTLTIADTKDGRTAISISTEVKCNNLAPKGPFKILKLYTAKKITAKEVTPWIGKKGEHIYDETYIRKGAM
ncbi:hypothetical protein [Bdellovibrio sp. KM01]|uniref:hypothetical protein n=1 Tax=Bdellovibrio sp. KM01 TaxID=2748865 RepID=UPI0015E98F7E|nr:hypothetical protein [Bdellovibrio sp. KM01]QLY24003.1 hypothetical protein HW988_10985 [Bdellovibrio sp. KM01]